MIGVIDVECQAANPNMPLYPMRAFVGSPSSIRVRNVPKRIGDWCIRSVEFTAVYPDGTVKSASCVLTGGVWVGTIEGTSTSGTSQNGYTIFASGTDENGNAVTGYVLGKGDIEILEADGTLSPDPARYYVKLLSAEAETPREGDMYPTEGGYVIWQNGQANKLGTPFEEITAYVDSQVSSKADLSVLNGYLRNNADTAVIQNLTCDTLIANAAYIVGYAKLSDLSSKADVSALHQDYIEDSAGNRINANLSCTYIDNTAWEVTDPSSNKYVLDYVGFIQSYRIWECIVPENIKLVLTYANDWELQVYTWQEIGPGGDHDWVLDINGSYNGDSDITTIPDFVNGTTTYNYSARRPATKHLTLATQEWVDIVVNSELPTKTSDLSNDSGFITTNPWTCGWRLTFNGTSTDNSLSARLNGRLIAYTDNKKSCRFDCALDKSNVSELHDFNGMDFQAYITINDLSNLVDGYTKNIIGPSLYYADTWGYYKNEIPTQTEFDFLSVTFNVQE